MRSGVAYLEGKERRPNCNQWADLDVLASMIADQPHNFGGKAVQCYHSFTRGFFLNEIIRRADPQHRSLGQLVQEVLAKPLGIEYYYGLPQELNVRVANLIHHPYGRTDLKPLPAPPGTGLDDPVKEKVVIAVNSTVRGHYQTVINTYDGKR